MVHFFSKKVTGTVDVSKTVTATPVTPIEGQTGFYSGAISARVEAADLLKELTKYMRRI